jgi:hypothetical protein
MVGRRVLAAVFRTGASLTRSSTSFPVPRPVQPTDHRIRQIVVDEGEGIAQVDGKVQGGRQVDPGADVHGAEDDEPVDRPRAVDRDLDGPAGLDEQIAGPQGALGGDLPGVLNGHRRVDGPGAVERVERADRNAVGGRERAEGDRGIEPEVHRVAVDQSQGAGHGQRVRKCQVSGPGRDHQVAHGRNRVGHRETGRVAERQPLEAEHGTSARDLEERIGAGPRHGDGRAARAEDVHRFSDREGS